MNESLVFQSIFLFLLFLFFSYYQNKLSETPYREGSSALISLCMGGIVYYLLNSMPLALLVFGVAFYVFYTWISFTPFTSLILYIFTIILGLYLVVVVLGGILSIFSVIFSKSFLGIWVMLFGVMLAFFGWQFHKFFLITIFAGVGAFILAIFALAISGGEWGAFSGTFLIVFFLGIASQYQKLSPDDKDVLKSRLDKIEPMVGGISPYISDLIELAEKRKTELEKDLKEYEESREGRKYSDDFVTFVEEKKGDIQKKVDEIRKSEE